MENKVIKCLTTIIPLLSSRQQHIRIFAEVQASIWPILHEDRLSLQPLSEKCPSRHRSAATPRGMT